MPRSRPPTTSPRSTPTPRSNRNPKGIYCRKCRYDLSATASPDHANPDPSHSRAPDTNNPPPQTPPCPQCNPPLDPRHPRTFAKRPQPSLHFFLISRLIPSAAIAIAIVAATLNGWIPLPGTLAPSYQPAEWTLWYWKGDRFGFADRPLNGQTVRVHWWNDDIHRITRRTPNLNADGAITGYDERWSVERHNNTWTVAADAGTPFNTVLAAWNATRRGNRFGLIIIDTTTPPTSPLLATGSEAQTLTQLARAWNTSLAPSTPAEQLPLHDWVWDHRQRRVLRVPAHLAFIYAGYDPRDTRDPRHPQNRWQSPPPNWQDRLFNINAAPTKP